MSQVSSEASSIRTKPGKSSFIAWGDCFSIGLPHPLHCAARKAGRRNRNLLYQDMLYKQLEQSPEEVRAVSLLPPAWWKAGMGPHLPDEFLRFPSTRPELVEADGTVVVDAEVVEGVAEHGPKEKGRKTMVAQHCRDWLLDFVEYQKKEFGANPADLSWKKMDAAGTAEVLGRERKTAQLAATKSLNHCKTRHFRGWWVPKRCKTRHFKGWWGPKRCKTGHFRACWVQKHCKTGHVRAPSCFVSCFPRDMMFFNSSFYLLVFSFSFEY
eukprot:3186953-Amphidinium_carterae.1